MPGGARLREQAELDAGVVDVEERAGAQEASIGELRVDDRVHGEEAAGGSDAAERLAVGAQQLARRAGVAAAAQPFARAVEPRVRERVPQLPGVGGERFRAEQGLRGQRVLVLEALGAQRRKGLGVTTGPGAFPRVEEVVHAHTHDTGWTPVPSSCMLARSILVATALALSAPASALATSPWQPFRAADFDLAAGTRCDFPLSGRVLDDGERIRTLDNGTQEVKGPLVVE